MWEKTKQKYYLNNIKINIMPQNIEIKNALLSEKNIRINLIIEKKMK